MSIELYKDRKEVNCVNCRVVLSHKDKVNSFHDDIEDKGPYCYECFYDLHDKRLKT